MNIARLVNLYRTMCCSLKVVKPENENSLVPASSNSYWNSTWTHQPLANDLTNNALSQSKVIQSVYRGVCNIDCNGKDCF